MGRADTQIHCWPECKEDLKAVIQNVRDIVEDYIFTDGAHHKQQALVSILQTVLFDEDFEEWIERNREEGYELDEGVS
jgi:hypothetical protein